MDDTLPAPKNGWIDGTNSFLSILLDASTVAAKTALVAVAPFFGWPVVSQLTDFFMNRIRDALLKELQNSTTFIIIDIQEAQKLHDYLDELDALKKAQDSGGDDSAELEKTRKALGDLIHIGA